MIVNRRRRHHRQFTTTLMKPHGRCYIVREINKGNKWILSVEVGSVSDEGGALSATAHALLTHPLNCIFQQLQSMNTYNLILIS